MGWLLLQLPVQYLCPQGLYYPNGSEIYKFLMGWLLLQLPVQHLCPQGLYYPNGS